MNLTPFLLFDGNCADAMTFYHSCLGGELTVTLLSDTPMKEDIPPEHHQKVVYAYLKSGDIEFSATDWMLIERMPLTGRVSPVAGDVSWDQGLGPETAPCWYAAFRSSCWGCRIYWRPS